MRHAVLSLVPPLLASITALAACGLEHEQLRASNAPRQPLATPVDATLPVADVESGLPDTLRCVSAPLTAGTSDVLRVDLARGVDGTFTASVQHGPQFWSHGGHWFGEDGTAWPVADTFVLDALSKGGLVTETAGGTLTIDLEKDGALFVGTFEQDECYQHIESALTCWNDLALFGSPWAGVSGALDARYDWTTGACVGSDGAPSMNALPLEVVRETGFAECTTLRGRLNGDDFNYPDLVGWNLTGADLADAELFFANLTQASLYGADLTGFEFGYAEVSGAFDATTTRPVGDACSEVESPWGGATLECRQ